MLSRLSKPKGLLLIGIIIASIATGAIYLSPKIDGDNFTGGFLGFIFAIFFSRLLFPELRKSSSNIWNGNNILGINMKNYFTHPTQIPLMLGILWFGLGMIGLVVFDLKITTDADTRILLIWLVPSFFLFGLSGFLMLRRNEYVNQFGKLTTGFWARFNGILGILFGWGGCILLLVVIIFNL